MAGDLVWCSGALLLRQLRLAAKEMEAESALYTKSARGGIGDSPVELSHLTERAGAVDAFEREIHRALDDGAKRYSCRTALRAARSSAAPGRAFVIVEEAPLASVTGGE